MISKVKTYHRGRIRKDVVFKNKNVIWPFLSTKNKLTAVVAVTTTTIRTTIRTKKNNNNSKNK